MKSNTTYIFYILTLTLSLNFIGCNKSIPFNSNTWKSTSSYSYKKNDITDRQKMLKDMLQVIKGKSKLEIIKLLGPGKKTAYFKKTENNLVYLLGPERSFFSIDNEWLLLNFDKNEKLTSHSITTD